jgi:hypothetical protein
LAPPAVLMIVVVMAGGSGCVVVVHWHRLFIIARCRRLQCVIDTLIIKTTTSTITNNILCT